VSYVVLVDPSDGSVLLVDHVKAGLWLPPGGHVDPDEHPTATARRQLLEELGLEPEHLSDGPVFLTRQQTVGTGPQHTDVSLWFVAEGRRDRPLTPDAREVTATRWWTRGEVVAGDPLRFDPHFARFVAKLAGG
jgi:8-oxo-dGTP diphosphatase